MMPNNSPVAVSIAKDPLVCCDIYTYRTVRVGPVESNFMIGGVSFMMGRCGIVWGIKQTVFILVGLTTAISGIILSSRLMSVAPTAGQGYELDIIAAVVIGGTSISGGRGSIGRTVAGVIVLSIINNGFNLLDVSEYIQLVFKGSIIIAAVALDVYSSKRFR